jgi:hypothetical protein
LPITNFGFITPAGSYYILVRETAGPNVGCSIASANFNILESPELLLTVVGTIIKIPIVQTTVLLQLKLKRYRSLHLSSNDFYHTAINYSSRLGSGNTFTRPGSLTGLRIMCMLKMRTIVFNRMM